MTNSASVTPLPALLTLDSLDRREREGICT